MALLAIMVLIIGTDMIYASVTQDLHKKGVMMDFGTTFLVKAQSCQVTV